MQLSRVFHSRWVFCCLVQITKCRSMKLVLWKLSIYLPSLLIACLISTTFQQTRRMICSFKYPKSCHQFSIVAHCAVFLLFPLKTQREYHALLAVYTKCSEELSMVKSFWGGCVPSHTSVTVIKATICWTNVRLLSKKIFTDIESKTHLRMCIPFQLCLYFERKNTKISNVS